MKKIKHIICITLAFIMVASCPMQVFAENIDNNEYSPSSVEKVEDDQNVVGDNTSEDVNNITEQNLENTENFIQSELSDDESSILNNEVEDNQVSENAGRIVDYVYVESLQVLPGEKDGIVVSLLDKTTNVEDATLYCVDDNKKEYSVNLDSYVEGVMLFYPNTNVSLGNYHLDKLIYYENDIEKVVELVNEGVEAFFSVVSEKDTNDVDNNSEDLVETTVQVVNDDGTTEEVSTIEEGLEIAGCQQTTVSSKARVSNGGNVVVVLDPGHDNQHTGAVSAVNSINEEVYTLQIAKACRAELQQYNGVEVYLTVEENGDTRWLGSTVAECLKNRVDYAKNVGADLFVSIHLNAATQTSAYGAEVFVSNYSKYNEEGTNLANKVLDELGKLGLDSRGVKIDIDSQQASGNKYDDGNWVDDLSVIRNSSLSGFPSILIEHGFISNSEDASIIKSKTIELGQADAKAIAEHLNLTKGAFGVSPGGQVVAGESVILRAYPQNIEEGYNQYRFIYYNGNTWESFNDFSEDITYEWTPSDVGNSYILGMEAKNSAGDVKQYINWSYYSVVEPTVNIKGISVLEKQNGMLLQLEPQVETNSKILKYRYQIYDVNREVWTTLEECTAQKSIEWTPSKSGTYWIHVVAIAPTGAEYAYTMGYVVDEDRACIEQFTCDKTSVFVGEEISLNAKYKVLEDGNTKHQFLAYNGQYWTDISGASKETLLWTPKQSGAYLLCYQIITGNGKVYQSFISVNVEKITVNLYGINAGTMDSDGKIKLSANVTTNDPGVTYTFKVYDMQKWICIADNSKNKDVVWEPKKSGAHLLYLEVKDTEGKSYSYSMGYGVPDLIKIDSFSSNKNSPQGIGNEIVLNANVTKVNSVNATYEYMCYNGEYWKSISKSDSLEKAIWVPKAGGSYLLCFQIVTEAGEIYQTFLGYDITEPYVEIQGIDVGDPNEKGEMTLNARFKTNDNGLVFTYKVYDMDKWSLICDKQDKGTVVWKPSKAGDYLLYLEITGSTGKVYTYCMGCSVKDNLRITGLDMDLQSPQIVGNEITLSGHVSALFSEGLKYEYMIYDGKTWSLLSSADKLEKVSWTPSKSGTYSLCFQVINKDGKIVQWFSTYTIDNPKVSINSISVGKLNSDKQVELQANILTNDSKLSYTFKAYDMEKWVSIVEKSESPVVKWNFEKEGTYLLYLVVYDRTGKEYTYSMGCNLENNVKITNFESDLKSPQKLMDGLTVELKGTMSATYSDGLICRYMVYNGEYWELIDEMSDNPLIAYWTPEKQGDFLLCFQIETDSGRQINQFMSFCISSNYYIMGENSTTIQQMVAYFNANNSSYDKYSKVSGYDGVLAQGGAPTIEDFCTIFMEEATAEGVKVEVAFCQAMLETGFLKFGGDVKPDQYNFAGLGATGGVPGNRFSTVREGIRAQVQHLKCYATTEPLNNPCVDQRWAEYLRGSAPTVEQLSLKWASSSSYGENILNCIYKLRTF